MATNKPIGDNSRVGAVKGRWDILINMKRL